MSVKIDEAVFGKLNDAAADLKTVKKFTLTNRNDFSVCLISYGAAIQSIRVKDKRGEMTSVVLGFDCLEGILI